MFKVCPKCKIEKHEIAFRKAKKPKSGRASWCKECSRKQNISKYHEDMRDPVKKAARDKRNREARYIYKYGITYEQKSEMIEEQGGLCAICARIFEGFSEACVDHSHDTGKVRGLLCVRCNTSLASVEDKNFLRKATEYLNKYEV